MNVVKVMTEFGFEVDLPFDGENYYCLVCGFKWEQVMPWYSTGGMTFEFCPNCHMQYGVIDMPRESEGQTHAERINEFRIDWLNKTGWRETDLEQLERVLGIVLDRPQSSE
jgi:hypothetical protein